MVSPWYQHHYIGEFAGDALATANCNSRGWGAAPPNGLIYFDTVTGTLRYANGGVWNALGGAVTKHDYGTMHIKQPLVQRYLASKTPAEIGAPECNAQRRVAVDSSGNEYFVHYSQSMTTVFITKITTDKRIMTFVVPYVVQFDDVCLCMNSLDELVLVYDDGFSLWVSKCPTTGNYLPDGAWTTPVQVNVIMSGPFAVVAAIDSNDLLWLVYADLSTVSPPSLTCVMYYAQLNCSVFNTTPTITIPEAVGPALAYPASWALEIDGSDRPHVAYGAGAVAPAHNIWHTYYTLGAWTTPVQMETQTWTSPWNHLSMVIAPSGRVTVSATQDDSFGYWGVFMNPPYIVGGKDPPANFSYGVPFQLLGQAFHHQISINDAGLVVHATVFQFGLGAVQTNKLTIFKTTTDLVPDMVDTFGAEFYFYQIFDLEGEVGWALCHWAYHNHNRPNYDYPFIAILRAALIFDTFTPNQYIQYEFVWDALGE